MTTASIHQLRRRIQSTRSLAQVTRAMQTVAASKLRKVQQQAIAAQPYDEWSQRFMRQLSSGGGETVTSQPLLQQPPIINSILIIVVTSDRGLCGSYNQNVVREALLYLKDHPQLKASFITVGRKGQQILSRLDYSLTAHFEIPRSGPDFALAADIAHLAIDEFIHHRVQEVQLAYTHFRNILTHPAKIERFLPLSLETEKSAQPGLEFVFEPSSEAILGEFLPRSLETHLYHALLEAATSEQASRMVAMENASRNAEDLVQELTVAYNKARQQRITREILDIASGAEALEDNK